MPDYLSCGSCPVDFELADIVSFIEHKRQRCVDSNTDSDQLECIKCSKRFHTPWPLLIHIQVDHQILVVRNLHQLSLPLGFKTSVTPIAQSDESNPMEIDDENNQRSTKHRDMFTQTMRSRTSSSCCQPRSLPPCCQKLEPQCYDEPCLCTSVSNICTSETCYINIDNQHSSDSDGNPTSCCTCPQGSLKKESREVQTDLEYSEDVDISFLLSNNPSNSREFNGNLSGTFSQNTAPFNGPEYSGDYSITIEKGWDYFNQSSNQVIHQANGNYLTNFDNRSYQTLMPNLRQAPKPNQSYVPSNHHMVAEDPNRSSASSPNDIPNTDNTTAFPVLSQCPMNPSLNGHTTTTTFHESNNSFHYKNLTTDEQQAVISTILMSNTSPTNKDSTRSFSRNEHRSLTFIPSSSDLSADFNTENYENEKIENEKKEFRFLCPNCGKRFRQKVHLRKHVMSQHARQKPHKCSQCGYTTVEKSHLTVHIRTHTGERPYTCRRCSYSSAQNCTLKSHYLRRHPGDQIECILCTSYFITEQERNNHQRSCRIVNGVPNGGNTSAHNQNTDNSAESMKPA